MEELQRKVKELVKKYDLETTSELRYIDLASEIGEVGKEILKGSNYGKREFEVTEELESELGDALFSLICLANGVDINLENALEIVLNKYEDRFSKKGDIGSGK